MKKGAFIFVLHSHLPYVRKKGKWPHGEEMIFEAMCETYIPLLNALNELSVEGYHPHLTISLTPILLEQLADKYLKQEFIEYLNLKIDACNQEIVRYTIPKMTYRSADDRIKHAQLAQFYLNFYETALKSFKKTYKKDLIGAFKKLQEKGVLDIITSSATHAYLPLFIDEDSINEQLKVGVQTYRKYFGINPRGIWLPECGYRPLKKNSDYTTLTGFEKLLEEFEIKYFFTDSHVFSSAGQINIKEFSLVGPYNYKEIRYEETYDYSKREDKPTHKPYTVSKSKVAVFARDNATSLQVWSGDFGYPGDFYYREFHAKDSVSGLQYCRITHHNGLIGKELYDPEIAKEKVKEHADHFVHLVEGRVNEVYESTGEYASIVSSYDTELFGHWWFEGVDWLKEVLKRFENSEAVDLSCADNFIDTNPPKERIAIPESSWGLGGGHYVWMNDETSWIWPIIHNLSLKVKNTAKDFPEAKGVKKDILNQALRELLLLHSSDWPFLISTIQAKDYAIERFNEHKERCERLLEIAYNSTKLTQEEKEFVKMVCDADNPFSELDYKDFGKQIDMA